MAACYKMDVNKLGKGELTYELAIRGIAPGTVESMRTRLAMARRMEKSGDSFTYPKYPFTPGEDIAAVKQKLDELFPQITSFNESSSSPSFSRLLSKLHHTLNRIDHIPSEESDRPDLLARVLTLLKDLHEKAEAADSNLAGVNPPQILPLTGNTSSPNPSHQHGSVSANLPTPRVDVKPIFPNKWDCKFSGDKKGLSLSAFLQRVEELRIARHVTKDILLESGIDLFGG